MPDLLSEYLSPLTAGLEIPEKFQSPFDQHPHPLALHAAKLLQTRLAKNTLLSDRLSADSCGKMFGVLVVLDRNGAPGYISAFSGKLDQQWLVSGYVPPVFDLKEQSDFLAKGEAELNWYTSEIDRLKNHPERIDKLHSIAKIRAESIEALSVMKREHRNNKRLRKITRSDLGDGCGDQSLMRDLAFRSQQDKRAFKRLRASYRGAISLASEQLEVAFETRVATLEGYRKQLSQELHRQVFETCRLLNGHGEEATIKTLFDDKTPPGGSGDCAAPKLLQFAHKHQLKPLALAEFWWGGPPVDRVREHREYYPPCRGKCQVILPFMLSGVEVEPETSSNVESNLVPDIIYEDDYIVAINKPVGLLSIPGKKIAHSAYSWLVEHYPYATGPLLVHRLDMSTSGLLLAAKNAQTHKHLQKQFIERRIEKRYLAILSKPVKENIDTIRLPLRVDLNDRPRQMVCYEHGKMAETRVEIISRDTNSTRVYFYPVTGRTHQLRVHAAHHRGLASPIVGDELYGKRAERLMLHAETLSFCHPNTGKCMTLTVASEF